MMNKIRRQEKEAKKTKQNKKKRKIERKGMKKNEHTFSLVFIITD